MNINDMKISNTTADFSFVTSLIVTAINNNHVILVENKTFCQAIKRDVNNLEILGSVTCFNEPHEYYLTLQTNKFFFIAPANSEKNNCSDSLVVIN